MEEVFESALWRESHPPRVIADHWSGLRTRLEKLNPNWRFWIDWYESHLRGGKKDWPLLTNIVLIPNDDWKQGPAHVNAIIAKMVAPSRMKVLVEATPNAEQISRNPISRKFEATAAPVEDEDR